MPVYCRKALLLTQSRLSKYITSCIYVNDDNRRDQNADGPLRNNIATIVVINTSRHFMHLRMPIEDAMNRK